MEEKQQPWGNKEYQPTTLRKKMCEECPHKDMHMQFTVAHQYPDTPHPCHMLPGYACKGAYLELQKYDALNISFKPDCENGV